MSGSGQVSQSISLEGSVGGGTLVSTFIKGKSLQHLDGSWR